MFHLIKYVLATPIAMYKFNEGSGSKVQNAKNQAEFGDLSIILVLL